MEYNKFFLITVDTEADNQWNNKHECTTENAKFLSRFQELAEKYSFKPTWLTTYEMANNKYFVNYFKKKQENGLCEIGMHLHAWNTPPNFKLEAKTQERSYLIEYPKDIMDKKIGSIDKLLTEKFGIKPISHRAGRWAMNDDYFDLLRKYGYKIDCSVTPHINWSNSFGLTGISGSNYTNYSEKTFMANDCIFEIPMTIRHMHFFQYDRVKSIKSFLGEIKRFFIGRNQWMRPDKYLCYSGLKKIIDKCSNENTYIMFMIHSSELMAGGSPNFKNIEEIDRLYKIIEKSFNYAKKKGYIGKTLTEFYKMKREIK